MPTVADLKKKCKQLKLKGYSTLRKAELEALLNKHQKKQDKVIPSDTKRQKKQEKEPILKKKKTTQIKRKNPFKKQEKEIKEQKIFGLESRCYRWIEKTYKDENGFSCIQLFPNTYLYRGNKIKTNLQNRETYFAPWYGTSRNYLPKRGEGYFEIYKLKNENLKLFDLSNIDNVNKLLRDTFYNKEDYNMIKKITLGKIVMTMLQMTGNRSMYAKYFTQLETPSQPYQFKILLRTSIIKEDFKFGQWLCKRNYDGYAAKDMYYTKDFIMEFPSFPAEIMLCTPKKDLQMVKCIKTKRFNTITNMEQTIGKEFLNPRI
jgi:hypothetical protein